MKQKYQQLTKWLTSNYNKISPGKNAITGAAKGLLVCSGILWVLHAIIVSINIKDNWILLLFLSFTLMVILASYLSLWGINKINSIPKVYKVALGISIPLFFMMSYDWHITLFLVLMTSLFGAGILVLKKTGFTNLSRPKQIISLAGLVLGATGLITAIVLYIPSGFEIDPIENAASINEATITPISAASPAEKGNYKVKTLHYGSGKDRHRKEFGNAVDIKTDSVNGVAFIDDWNGFGGWWREKYWGFNSSALPINGSVWYPEGEGPFPLVLIVHGNHPMQDFSDPGYAYLGNLLASRGIILASVDENFINGSWSDIFGGLEEENDARGWLLLEHLRVWHNWNKTSGNIFNNKVDTSKIALIGHSRGGEAVAHAVMFNKLSHYPDDASIKFDYNFNIQSIIAIAPVDGQYKPGDSRTKIEDVDYFVFHGAQDADVRSFRGTQQYERVSFNDSLYHFKTGLYIAGANHGQFNTSWGRSDVGNPFTGLLNLKQLLSAEDQRKIAEVYISSFLEITLRNKKEYLPMFIDSRRAKNWLPETIYLNQFEDSNASFLCTFEEDFDVVTTTEDSGTILTKNLSVWREEEIQLKWEKKGSRAAVLGWHYEEEDADTIVNKKVDSLIASYSIHLKPRTISIDSSAALVFSMAESTEDANPKTKGKWIITKDNKEEKEESKKKKDKEKDDAKKSIDFSIVLKDSLGQSVSFSLSEFSALQREIDPVIWKMEFLTSENTAENVFQLFYFPLDRFKSYNAEFNIETITKIEFVFDKTDEGVVIIDNIGFMKSL
ncbi:chlorophyllase/cutinase-like alpha/beta fold protein [Eudoraea chungangensis]|uniref:poly(ethylene terephthalate) hydrolase family protein n=1 Tax=Eudoraea chungangensis TaxID=1481905 RepID=UPI0023EBDFD4|nr:hypothetical protein [Eudoraea chungangensis]